MKHPARNHASEYYFPQQPLYTFGPTSGQSSGLGASDARTSGAQGQKSVGATLKEGKKTI